MKQYKELLNDLSRYSSLRELSEEESSELKRVYLNAFKDIVNVCNHHNIDVMMIGGSALGAIRHQGFIPWDDDLDVAMSRNDFEKFKNIFERELGDKYILSSPNYKNNAKNRFPMVLIKNTKLLEIGDFDESLSNIKIDIFIIENVPDNILYRYIKGMWCTALMFVASCEQTFENKSESFKTYMCSTEEGRKAYRNRNIIGRLFSFKNSQEWFDLLDRSFQYNKETSYTSIPSGRGHYFGEIIKRESFFPCSYGKFEGIKVKLPNNPDTYLTNLYGSEYMIIPPEKEHEKHLIIDVIFNTKDADNRFD